MATTIGNLAVILSANAAGFTQGFAAAQKTAGSFISTMGNLARSAGAIVGIGTAVGIVAKAFKGFSDHEESLLTFEALIGSAGKAKAFKEELKDFGDTTAFGDSVEGAAKKLMEFNFPLESVLPTLKKLSDVASGVSVPLEELATVVGKSGYRASISGKQLIALTELGVPIMQELTKTTGLSQAAIAQLAEQGAIKFEHLMGAFDSASAAGGNFYEMTARRAELAKGLMSRIVSQIGDVIGRMGSVIGNRLSTMFGAKNGMSSIFNWLQKVETGVMKMGPWFQNVMLVVETAGDAINSVWTGVSKTFTYGWDVISGGLSDLGFSVSGFQTAFTDAMTAVRFVFQNFGDLTASILGRAGLKVFTFGADLVYVFTNNIPEALKWFSENWRAIWDNIATYMKFKLDQMSAWANKAGAQFNFGLANLLFNAGLVDHAHADAHFKVLDNINKNAVAVPPPVFKEIPAPVFGKRAPGDAEKNFADNLDAIDARLAVAKQKILTPDLAKIGIDGIIGGVGSVTKDQMRNKDGFSNKTSDIKYAGAIEAGSKEAYNVILRSRGVGLAPANRTAKASEETAKHTKRAALATEKMAQGGAVLAMGSLDIGGNA